MSPPSEGRSSTQDIQAQGALDYAIHLLVNIRTSFTKFTIALGIFFLLIALVLQDGLGAAMLGTIGLSAIIYGIVGRALLRAIGYI